MTDKKIVPIKVALLFDEARVLKELRDVYAGKTFGYKKAVKAAKAHLAKKDKFWIKVRELYPELGEKTLAYDQATREVWDKEVKDGEAQDLSSR